MEGEVRSIVGEIVDINYTFCGPFIDIKEESSGEQFFLYCSQTQFEELYNVSKIAVVARVYTSYVGWYGDLQEFIILDN